MTTYRVAMIGSLFLLSACGSEGSGSAPAATTAAPPKPPVTATAASSAAAESVCPAGSTGAGTSDEPCKGSGQLIEAKWTGKTNNYSVFTVTNKLPHEVSFVWARAYYYDKNGKQLEVTLPGEKSPYTSWSGSGATIIIDGNATKDFELGWKKEQIPKDTATIEMEFSKVGWKKTKDSPMVYWQNPDLGKQDRPMGGKKP